ncbi:MAG: branched-chain amino acid ABC transporter permease [Kofleriaceae bacterium]
MTKLLQTLVNSLALGSLYALTALGYTLVYGVLRFINFAHSDVFTVGAWSSFALAGALGFGITGSPVFAMPLVLLAAMGICAALGVAIETLAYRPLRRAPRLNVLITAIGVSLFLQNVGQLRFVWGTQPQRMPPLIEDRSLVEIAGVHIRLVDVTVVILTALLLFALEALIYRTKLGRAMRAVSFDERVASLMGIDVNKIISITFGIGSALAAAAGLLFALKYESIKQSADATWVLLGLKAFVAAVVGGIGNVRGAVAGALLIAFVEMFGAAYFSPHMRDLYVFVILIVVLLVKPSGLFGKAVVEKV